MIPSIYLENYRLFDQLALDGFQRVNLIVGKNNSGKSALLEAIYLYLSGVSEQVLVELSRGRQEFSVVEIGDLIKDLNPLRHFFKGHAVPGVSASGLKLGVAQDQIEYEVVLEEYAYGEPDGERRKYITPGEIIPWDDADVHAGFVVRSGGQRRFLNIDRHLNSKESQPPPLFHRTRSVNGSSGQDGGHSIFVPTNGISNARAAQYWDLVNLTALEEEVVKGLQIVEPSVQGIAFVGGGNGGGALGVESQSAQRVPKVRLDGVPEPIPLKSLGDGVGQVFHVVLAMVNAKNGTVFLDEFENGLHWSIQADIWDVVFNLAERMNVQVFATTHSRDCVESFRQAWSDHPADGAFYRLEGRGQSVHAQPYDLETLGDSIDTNVEMR